MRLDRDTIQRFAGGVRARAVFSIRTAIVSVSHNKLRAALTSLGILFGVASVIAMLAIGKGAEQEILEQMRLLGSNNVMVTPLVEQKEEPATDEEPRREIEKYTPGLTRQDAGAIAEVIPAVDVVSGEMVLNTFVTGSGIRRSAKAVGVDTTYFGLTNLDLAAGKWFTPVHTEHGMPVAIIGHGVRTRFFTTEDPIGKSLKVGDGWLTVVGVLADRRFSEQTAARLGIRDANMDVYVPLSTMLLRYRNRASLTQRDIELAARPYTVTMGEEEEETPEQQRERTNRNQLDRIIVHVSDSRLVPAVADVMRRLLERRHNGVIDFEITIPELLLKQEQRTKTIFNVVLGAIASISLVVGGIGIMNIMLASVLERIREIGVRRAVGARQREILLQFLSEAVLISVAGGVAGILVGAGLSAGIERAAGITTIVSYTSVFVAFGVSFSVGLLFGIVPAYRAARQDPVICLRYE
jgi:putative ABC transport system permease protein